MKVVQFNQLIEEHRRNICSYRSALKRVLGEDFTEGMNDKFIASINKLGGMLDNIYKSMGTKFKVSKYEDVSRLGKEMTFRPLQQVPSIVSDIRGRIAALVTFLENCNKKEFAREYQNLIANDNSRIKLTSTYKKNVTAAAKNLKELLEEVEEAEVGLYDLPDEPAEAEEAPAEETTTPPAEDPPAETPAATTGPAAPAAEEAPAVHPKAVKDFIALVEKKEKNDDKILKASTIDSLKKAVKAAKIEVEDGSGKGHMIMLLRKHLSI